MRERIMLGVLALGILAGQVVRFQAPAGLGNFSLADLVVAVVIVIALTSWVSQWWRQRSVKINWAHLSVVDRLVLSFHLVLVLTFLLSLFRFPIGELKLGLAYLIRLETYLSLYWVVRGWAHDSLGQIGRWFVLVGLIVAVIGFVQLVYLPDFSGLVSLGFDPHVGRLTSTFLDPNFVAVFLGIGLTLAVSLMFFGPNRTRVEYFVLSIIILLAMYLAYSRSGYLAAALMVTLVGFRKGWLAGIMVVVVMVGLLMIPGRFSSRFNDAVNLTKVNTQDGITSSDDTANARIESWKRGWQVVRYSPIIGVGYNNYGAAGAKIGSWDPRYLHGTSAAGSDASLLNTWATTGIFGLLIMVGLLFRLIWSGLTTTIPSSDVDQAIRFGFSASLFGLIANSLLINSLYYPPILIFWIVLAGYATKFDLADRPNQ